MTTAIARTSLIALIDVFVEQGGILRPSRHGGWGKDTHGLDISRLGNVDVVAAAFADGTFDCAVADGFIVKDEDGSYRLAPEVGMGATLHGWSDSDPYEVVAVSKSGKQITLRAMHAKRDESVTLEWVAGGFAGHCINQRDQRWILSSDPEGKTIKARLTKKGWSANGARVSLGEAHKFYDYNF